MASKSATVISSGKENMDYSNKSENYSYLEGFHIEEDSLIESLPSLYFSEVSKKEDTDDTEDDEDDTIPSKQIVKNTPPLFEKTPLLSSSLSHSQLNTITPIQTYLPQLNHSLCSPTSSVVSSIRSKKSSRYNYPISHHSDNNSTCSTPETQFVPIPAPKRLTPLHSISTQMQVFSSAPVTPSSRMKNAFQKLRPAKHVHQSTNMNSVVPAELVSTIKLASSKHSIADKIRNKFQQQLDRTRNRSSLIEVPKPKAFSISRSSSLSSLSNWSARLSVKKGLSSSATMTNVPSLSSCETEERTPFSLKKSISSHKLYTHKKASCYGHSYPEEITSSPKKDSTMVRFRKMVSVTETFSKSDYDRASDPDAVCTRLTPEVAQQIKDELNSFKLYEMKVHESSRAHTHFFL